MRNKLGICQWFHYEDYPAVDRAAAMLRELGVRHLRTGVSWADYYRPHGRQWYDWQMQQLGEFEVLLSVWHTPPSISEGNSCASPPKRLQDYADFIDLLISPNQIPINPVRRYVERRGAAIGHWPAMEEIGESCLE